ncbi:MAG TPA: penicillin-binding protein 2 [Burkholderiaceae bacterium]|nr:penicillin-binding protein 2 [Burkholderiaceae bacterium]
MTELKNVEQEVRRFRLRLVAASAFVLFAFGLLAARLVYLQVYKHEELQTQAENNRITVVPIVPNRGLILDRNGIVLANNYSAYTLELSPAKIDDLDATIDRLATLVTIEPRDRKRFKRLMDENSKSMESLPIRTKLSDDEVARFTAQRFMFPGVDIKARLFRNYPLGQVGSHLIGYIGRINEAEKDKIDDSEDEANYRGTQYIGKLGIEQSYEAELHGTAGFEEMETSASGHPVRRLTSRPATPGNALVMSIDIKLQALVEDLFGDRRGALVAIDPRSGEVLAFVSKPNFDPNLFVDGIDQESWKALNESLDKPLLNRALRGTYAPGSTYKPFMALAALTLGKRTPQQVTYDPGFYNFGGHTFRDDKEGGHGSVDMYKSIVQSCDTYYYTLANDLGVDAMHDFMAPLGLGQLTGIDMQGELRGVLPSTAWKRNAYRKKEAQKWYAGETISLGIGQGYNSFTMLQLAQATATLASGGQRYKPHLVKLVENFETREQRRAIGEALPALNWKPEHVAVVRHAMYGVTQEGTARLSFANTGYQAGGKTGTAQVIGIKQGEKYNAKNIDERHRDHALFTAFAPLDTPTVALAMVVENAGFGADNAAPIARRVFDYLLMGQYPSEADIAATRLGQSKAPIGTPRPAASVPVPGTTVDGSAAALVGPSLDAVPVPVPAAQASGVAAGAARAALLSSAEPERAVAMTNSRLRR